MKRKTVLLPKIICNVVIYALAIVFLIPFLLSAFLSVKNRQETADGILTLPSRLHFENFQNALVEANIIPSFVNSIIITVGAVILVVFCASLAGYGIGRYYQKRTIKVYEVLISTTMMIPFQTIMIPLYQQLRRLNLLNTHFAAIIVIGSMHIAFFTILYTGFVRSIPIELEEAAEMEGYGKLQIFTRIIFPLLKPATVTAATLTFLWSWNEFNASLIILQQDSMKTIPIQQYAFFGQYSADYNTAFAAAIITMVPIIIFFLFAQKHVEAGLIEGAVKG
mgnify:CR=1 FL=1